MTNSDKQLERFSTTKLRQNEKIIDSLKAWEVTGKKNSLPSARGRLVLTNQRVCFYKKALLGERLDSINLEQLKSYETSQILKAKTINLNGHMNKISVQSWTDDETMETFSAHLDIGLAEHQTGQSPNVQPAVAASPLETIKKLAELRDANMISTQEFEAKKSELLSQV